MTDEQSNQETRMIDTTEPKKSRKPRQPRLLDAKQCQLTIRLPEEQVEKLKRLAAAEYRTLEGQIALFLHKSLEFEAEE